MSHFDRLLGGHVVAIIRGSSKSETYLAAENGVLNRVGGAQAHPARIQVETPGFLRSLSASSFRQVTHPFSEVQFTSIAANKAKESTGVSKFRLLSESFLFCIQGKSHEKRKKQEN